MISDLTTLPPSTPLHHASFGSSARTLRTKEIHSGPAEGRHSLHHLTLSASGKIIEKGTQSFDARAFSRLKFGAFVDIRRFAISLVNSLPSDILTDTDLLVTSAAHTYLATAASLLATQVHAAIAAKTGRVPELTKMHTNPIDKNFAALSPEERRKYLSESRYHIDRDLIAGKHVLVVDDIRVTGGHEESIRATLAHAPRKVTYLYAAELSAGDRAEIENQLNNTAIATLKELKALLNEEGTVITEKGCKFVLGDVVGPHTPNELRTFLGQLPTTIVAAIVTGAVVNGYAANPRYRKVMDLLHEELARAF